MKKILIVDDDESTCKLAASILKESYQVFTARDGIECISVLNENSDVALMIVDIYMPILDGLEVVKYVTDRCPQHQNLAIVAMSTDSSPETLKNLRKMRIKGWLNKPLQKKELLAFISHLISEI